MAGELSLKVYTVTTKATLDELIDAKPFTSPLAILIDFGIIVSQKTIDYFQYGIINSHFSLLPQWRGADPITFSILSGQKRTGISLMLLTAGMDEGPLLAQAEYELEPTETTPSLTGKLIELSNQSLQSILPLYVQGSALPAPQQEVTLAESKEPTYSRKLTKADSILDFTKPADVLAREIRAYLEWPKSRATLGGIEVIVSAAQSVLVPTQQPAGTVEMLRETNGLIVYCGEGYLCIDRLKPAGKREMSAAEFIRGYGSRLNQAS